MTKQIAMFGSARTGADSLLYKETTEAARYLVENNFRVATGGGPGLMEAANKGALSVCKEGCCSLGYSIFLKHEPEANPYVQQDCPHRTFHTRLEQFCQENDGFIALPGGYGTLLEIMMVLQLLQVEHMSKPLILVGEMWRSILLDVSSTLLLHGYVDKHDTTLFKCVNTPHEAATQMVKLLKG